MKKLWNDYKQFWREMPGAMIVVHFTVTGVVVVAVLLARGTVAGLLILAAIAKPCLTMDLMRK